MTIEEIAALTGATLREGTVSDVIESMTIRPEEAERGDLCFAEDEAGLEIAARSGAAAIVCQRRVPTPVACKSHLLEVEDVPLAALKLAGNLADEERVSLELLMPREITYLKMILKERRSVSPLPKAWKRAFSSMLEAKKPLYVTDDTTFYNALRPQKRAFSERADGYVVSADSLFRTTFKTGKYIYQYKQFPHFHLESLQKAIALCEKYALPYSLDKIGYTKHFRPIFLEGEPSVQEVMKNDKVVILSDNLEDIVLARNYAANVGSWMAKTIVAVPPKTKVEGVKYPTYYRSVDEILELIGSLNYNYLFVYTEDDALAQRIKEFRLQ